MHNYNYAYVTSIETKQKTTFLGCLCLRQLVDDKSVASCQKTCYKLMVKTCYPQAYCKLFEVIVQIRDRGLYRDFKYEDFVAVRGEVEDWNGLRVLEIPVKSSVEYLN